MGRVGRVQFTANLGREWTGISATTQRRDFQVSKTGFNLYKQKKGVSKKGLLKGGCEHAPQCIYCANKRMCLGYK